MKNQVTTQKSIPDNIAQIAVMIRNDWKNIYFGARPYLDAMMQINSIHEDYFDDSADSVVRYFLANATTWRGETARQIKVKLNFLVSQARHKD